MNVSLAAGNGDFFSLVCVSIKFNSRHTCSFGGEFERLRILAVAVGVFAGHPGLVHRRAPQAGHGEVARVKVPVDVDGLDFPGGPGHAGRRRQIGGGPAAVIDRPVLNLKVRDRRGTLAGPFEAVTVVVLPLRVALDRDRAGLAADLGRGRVAAEGVPGRAGVLAEGGLGDLRQEQSVSVASVVDFGQG